MDKLQLLESILGPSHKANRDYLQFHCPFCNHRKPKLGVSLGSGGWKCWVCPAKGSKVSTLFWKLQASKDKVQLSRELWKEKVQFKTELVSKVGLPKEFLPLWQPTGSFFFKKAKGYLESRGITENDILKYRLGYCENGKFDDMVIFPSYNQDGQVTFFQGRTFNQMSVQKFKIPDNINKKELLFDENLINWQEPIIIVESKLDAIAVRRNAYPNYGKTINPVFKQKLLEEGTPEIISCLDGDALNDAILQAEWFLNNGIGYKIVQLPIDEFETEKQGFTVWHDPSSLGYNQIWKYIKEAKPITEFEVWNYKLKQKLK